MLVIDPGGVQVHRWRHAARDLTYNLLITGPYAPPPAADGWERVWAGTLDEFLAAHRNPYRGRLTAPPSAENPCPFCDNTGRYIDDGEPCWCPHGQAVSATAPVACCDGTGIDPATGLLCICALGADRASTEERAEA